ncbi:glucosaminidase domain-containing protein [Akkermansia glycaniphila]|uniref:glucosaminidase domain-containing protein n=1 Tax=Akkermansia glycaniphila TaxID=1679444 RepID=UPI001C0363FD|nr:glucosaminidase domain-containing protein [Akkermansia glycaniphila]MBT9449544.1 glucosaminidase domain-containing protein [Akkermansia glycaniphila]
MNFIAAFCVTLLCLPLFADTISDLRPAIRKSAVEHGIDPVLMEAIIRFESGNGKSKAARQKNNFGGLMRKRGGLQKFETPEQGVEAVAVLLEKYRASGLTSVESIGRRYCRRSTGRWVRNINSYRKAIVEGKYGAVEEGGASEAAGKRSGSWFSQNAPDDEKKSSVSVRP